MKKRMKIDKKNISQYDCDSCNKECKTCKIWRNLFWFLWIMAMLFLVTIFVLVYVSAAEPTPYAYWTAPTPDGSQYLAPGSNITIGISNDRRYATPDFIFIQIEDENYSLGRGGFNQTANFTGLSPATTVTATFYNLSRGVYRLWGFALAGVNMRPIVNVFNYGGTPLEENKTNITIGIVTAQNTPSLPISYATPIISINSYDDDPTNDNIIVTATVINGTFTSASSRNFTENGAYTFTASNGTNTVSRTVTITNIDKTAPTATITYSTTALTNKSVIATLTANEDIHDGEDDANGNPRILEHTFTKNGSYTFNFEDLAGNEASYTATVNNILYVAPRVVTPPQPVPQTTPTTQPTQPTQQNNAYIPPPGPSIWEQLSDWFTENAKMLKNLALMAAGILLLGFLCFFIAKDRRLEGQHCVYVMENLVLTDTNNGNAKTFSNYIQEHFMDTTFLTTPNKENKNIFNIGNVKVVKEGKDIYNKQSRALFFPLPFIIRNRHEISHIWVYTSRASAFWATLYKKLYGNGRKLIVKCDSVIPDPEAKGLRKIWQKLTIIWPIKNADAVIGESPRILKAISLYTSDGKGMVMPNCVHIKDIDMTKFQRSISRKDKTIINIGRIEPIKGIIDLIKAFEIYYKQHPDWNLKIIGPLTNLEYVKEVKDFIRSRNLEASVHLLGPRYGDDLYEEMAKAHTYTIASHPLGDGRNNTLPYALYFGCQPVVTDVGDMKEIVEPLGIKCIKPQDPLQMAIGLEQARAQPLDTNILKEYIASSLDWSTYLPKLNYIFKQ